MKLEKFQGHIKWIEKKLSANKIEIKQAINRLERLGFIIKEGKKISLSKSNNNWVNTDKTSNARKNFRN